MKRQARTAFVALVALLILAGLFLGLTSKEARQGEEAGIHQKSPPIAVEVHPSGGKVFCIGQDASGSLVIQGHEGTLRMDQDMLMDAFTSAEKLERAKTISLGEQLSAYGLSDAGASVVIVRKNGETEQYWLGQASPFGDGNYILRKSDRKVLVTEGFVTELFTRTVPDYRYGELMPVLEEPARQITSVRLVQGENCLFHCTLRGKEELANLKGQAYSRYKLLEPIEASTSTFAIENKFLFPLASLTRGEVIRDYPDSLEEYGLSSPEYAIEVDSDLGKISILIGNTQHGITYVMRADEPTVLGLPEGKVEFLKRIDYLDLINHYLWVHSVPDVAHVRIIAGSQEHVLQMDEASPKLDGMTISDINATRLFLRVISVSVAKENTHPQALETGEDNVSFEVVYHDGTTHNLMFVPVNEMYCAVYSNGEATRLLTYERDIYAVLNGIAEIRAGKILSPI